MVGSGQGLTRKSYNRVERLATDKRSTLLGLFFSEEFFLNKIGTRNTIGLNKFWPIINGNASNHGWRQKWVIVFAKLLAIILRSFLSGGGGLNFIAISFIFLYRENDHKCCEYISRDEFTKLFALILTFFECFSYKNVTLKMCASGAATLVKPVACIINIFWQS